MSTSYNGFKAGDPSIFSPPGLDDQPVPGTQIQLEPGVHGGDIATVLFYVAAQLHARVDPAHDQAEGFWGYSFRPSKNDPNLISCHASGTAFDWRATAHPNGKRGTFSKEQVAEIRKILAEVDNVVYWGGDAWGGGTPDEMHFEIVTGATMMQISDVAKRLNAPVPAPQPAPVPAPPPAPAPAPAPAQGPLVYGERSERVRHLQEDVTRTFPAYNRYSPTGFFGDLTLAGIKEFQFRVGLAVDGVVGPRTEAALARYGIVCPR